MLIIGTWSILLIDPAAPQPPDGSVDTTVAASSHLPISLSESERESFKKEMIQVFQSHVDRFRSDAGQWIREIPDIRSERHTPYPIRAHPQDAIRGILHPAMDHRSRHERILSAIQKSADFMKTHAEEFANEVIDHMVSGSPPLDPRQIEERIRQSEKVADALSLWNLKHVAGGHRPLIWEYRTAYLDPEGRHVKPYAPSAVPVTAMQVWVIDPDCSPRNPDAPGPRTCILDSERARQYRPILEMEYVGPIHEHLDRMISDMDEAALKEESRLGPRPDWLGRGWSWAHHQRRAEAEYLTEKAQIKRRRKIDAQARGQARELAALNREKLEKMIKSGARPSGTSVSISGNPEVTVTVRKGDWPAWDDLSGHTPFEALRKRIIQLRKWGMKKKAQGNYFSWASALDVVESMEKSLNWMISLGPIIQDTSPQPETAAPPSPVRFSVAGLDQYPADSPRASDTAVPQSWDFPLPISTRLDVHVIEQRASQWGVPFIPYDVAKKYGYAP